MTLSSRQREKILAANQKEFGEQYQSLNFPDSLALQVAERKRADYPAELRDAGLDEIHFDIGATDYNLTSLKRAVGLIPTITVEIPAIPDEKERIKGLLGELRDTDVQHLNLHQLRLTPFNFDKLQARSSRQRNASSLLKGFEALTENGFIRTLT